MHLGFSLLTLFPDRVGGTETYVKGLLAQFMSGNGPERVTVLANRHVAAAYEGGGPVTVHHVRSYRAGDSLPTRALAMLGARAMPSRAARDVPQGLDAVHFPVTVPIPRTGVPEVITVHDVQHLDLPEFFPRAERLFRRWAYEGAARRAAAVVTVTEYSKRRLVESAGVDPDRIHVVHSGIDHARFNPEPGDDERVLAGIDLPERFLVYPANAWPHKNHGRLLEAIGLTADRDVHLVLTGRTGGYYGSLDRLMEAASKAGVVERMRHLGYVQPGVVPALYRRAFAMVFPSLYEGFGQPPLEAMACGCPVAAADQGSLREVCGDAALLFDPRSPEAIAGAIDRIAADAGLRATLRDAGLRRSREFDWATAAARHTAVFERVAATPPDELRS